MDRWFAAGYANAVDPTLKSLQSLLHMGKRNRWQSLWLKHKGGILTEWTAEVAGRQKDDRGYLAGPIKKGSFQEPFNGNGTGCSHRVPAKKE